MHFLTVHCVVCSDSIRLQQQLEELQIRLVTQEKKTADYECVQAELQEKKVRFFSPVASHGNEPL